MKRPRRAGCGIHVHQKAERLEVPIHMADAVVLWNNSASPIFPLPTGISAS